MRKSKAFTLIEFIVTLAVASVIALAFVSLVVPQINLYFFIPQRMRVQNAAFNLLDIMVEGAPYARGLRFAGPLPCATPPTPGITFAEAAPGRIRYTYVDTDGTNHETVLRFFEGQKAMKRRKEKPVQEAFEPIPYYAASRFGIAVEPFEKNVNGNPAIFRYYDASGTEFEPASGTLGNIFRVDIAVKVSSGSGNVKESEGAIHLKTGVEIKHTSVPCAVC